jgi:hypothetical protein
LAGIVDMHLPLHNLDDFLHYAIMKRKQQYTLIPAFFKE